jgi:hypothetical protein
LLPLKVDCDPVLAFAVFTSGTLLAVALGHADHVDDDEPLLAPFWSRTVQDANCTHLADCGYSGITPDECHARGCCFDTTVKQFWCSGVAKTCTGRADCSGHGDCVKGTCSCDAGFEGHNCSDTAVTTVHLIQSCHLDAGFTDLTAGVINK